jgi:hypothetical protein
VERFDSIGFLGQQNEESNSLLDKSVGYRDK